MAKNDILKYEVISKHEVPELSTIKISGISNEITLADTLKSIEDNAKGMKQIESEVSLKKAVMQNIINNHPEVKTIRPKLRVACGMFYEAERFVQFAEEKLKEFNDAQDNLNEEVKQIELQTGIKKMPVEEKIALIAKTDKKMKKSK